MRIPVFLTVLALLLVSGTLVCAQSLADVAKKEEDRRKGVNSTGKIYTNHDLKGVPAPPPDGTAQGSLDPTDASAADPSGTDTPSDAASAESELADDTPADDTEVKDEAYWRNRMETLTAQLERDTLLAEAVQTRVNSLTADFAGRDDPAQRAKIGVDRQKALAELARLTRVVAAETKALAALEEEARTAGVPPGWLR